MTFTFFSSLRQEQFYKTLNIYSNSPLSQSQETAHPTHFKISSTLLFGSGGLPPSQILPSLFWKDSLYLENLKVAMFVTCDSFSQHFGVMLVLTAQFSSSLNVTVLLGFPQVISSQGKSTSCYKSP